MTALGGQAPVGVLLVLVGRKAGVPVEGAVGLVRCAVGLALRVGAGARGQVGQAQADEGADEDPLFLVLQEVGEHPPRLGVGEREGRRQIVDDGSPDAFGLKAGEEESHRWSVSVVRGGCGYGTGMMCAGAGMALCGSSLFREMDPAGQRLPQAA